MNQKCMLCSKSACCKEGSVFLCHEHKSKQNLALKNYGRNYFNLCDDRQKVIDDLFELKKGINDDTRN